jgi:hypothetical protein
MEYLIRRSWFRLRRICILFVVKSLFCKLNNSFKTIEECRFVISSTVYVCSFIIRKMPH